MKAIKLFFQNTSINPQLLSNIIFKEACTNYLSQVCSIMVNTTSLNTEKDADNKHLVNQSNAAINNVIHTLECIFCLNKI